MNELIRTGGDGKGHRPYLIFDDGGDMTLLIQKGKKAEYLFLNYGNIPDPIFMYNVEFKIFQTIIKRQLEGGEIDKWNKIFNTCMGFSKETSTGVYYL